MSRRLVTIRCSFMSFYKISYSAANLRRTEKAAWFPRLPYRLLFILDQPRSALGFPFLLPPDCLYVDTMTEAEMKNVRMSDTGMEYRTPSSP